MHSDRYFHPEFGWLAPSSRLRREVRVGFFSMLFGLGIGVAAVTALTMGAHHRDSGSAPVVQNGDAKPLPDTKPAKRVEAASHTNPVPNERENHAVNVTRPSAPATEYNSDRGTEKLCLTGDTCRNEAPPPANPRRVELAPIARIPIGRSDNSGSSTTPSGRAGSTSLSGKNPQKTAHNERLKRPDGHALSDRENDEIFGGEGAQAARASRGSARNSVSSRGFWAWSW
jgi:hypothetical protein